VVASTAAAHTVKPSRDMLFRFAALEGAPDGDVLAYSQQWGLFDLCGHGVLHGHSWGEVPVSLLVAADLVSRIAIAPAELPVGAFTALLGVPFFLSLLRSER